MTACNKCKFFIKSSGIWHGQYCDAPRARRPKVFSPEHGKQMEDPRGVRPNVREINKGNCEFFKKRKLTEPPLQTPDDIRSIAPGAASPVEESLPESCNRED